MIITMPVLFRVKYLDRCKRYGERDRLADRFTARTAKILFFLTGSAVCIKGEENIPAGRAVLFVSNHQSHIDSAIIQGFINVPKGFVSIVEAKRIPILGTWMRYMKCVFLDRSDLRQAFKSIEECIRTLREGRSMVIYPEGRLSQDRTVGEFKKGCLRMAVKAGVPIVPVTLRDSYRIMRKNGNGIRAAKVECIISEPIPAAVVANTGEGELIKTVRNIIINNL